MADINHAIDVTTSVDVNWDELGRVFGDQRSDDQAKFLLGFYEATVDMQLAYIGSDPIFGSDTQLRTDVANFLTDLAEYIRGTGE